MIILLSPAKRLSFSGDIPEAAFTTPQFLDKSENLAAIMKKKSPKEIADLQDISKDLAEKNHAWFQQWEPAAVKEKAYPAVFAFNGDAYQGLSAGSFSVADLDFAQDHLRILSGLYGMLRPLDLIMPYRLEMGTNLKARGIADLYEFWRDTLTGQLIELVDASKSRAIVNLASDEYFDAIDREKLGVRVIKPVFKEYRNGSLKFLSYFGKRARGLMASHIIRYRVDDPEMLKDFQDERYLFDENLSGGDSWVFTR